MFRSKRIVNYSVQPETEVRTTVEWKSYGCGGLSGGAIKSKGRGNSVLANEQEGASGLEKLTRLVGGTKLHPCASESPFGKKTISLPSIQGSLVS
jgi:hypothetical protein